VNRKVPRRSTGTSPAAPAPDATDASGAPGAPDGIRPGSTDRAGAHHPLPDQAASGSAVHRAGAVPGATDRAGVDRADTDRATAGREPGQVRRSRRGLALTLAALVLLAIVPVFVARIYLIPSGSMESTLHGCPGCDNDRILVDKLAYRLGAPAPGDIVVFTLPATWTSMELQIPHGANPVVEGLKQLGSLVGLHAADETEYIKRVIAVGGQTVACCDERNRVLVDGAAVDEPYIYFLPEAGAARQVSFGPVRIPEGHLWVMGDSRNDSVDSRAEGNGPVPLTNVIGKARFIVYPFDRLGAIPAPSDR
jgi:signal peptidase I